MSFTALYVDAHTFTLSGDYTSKFLSGRAVRANCTKYGEKIVYVDYSSYSGTTTTVHTIQAESEDLTSDLTSVDVSTIKPNISSNGNLSSDIMWLYRGLKKGLYVKTTNVSTFTVSKGYLHVDDGGVDKILVIPAMTIVPTTSPGSWYYLYAVPPASGALELTSSDIIYTDDPPTLDYTKMGYYYGGYRCFGFFKTSGLNQLVYSFMDDKHLWFLATTYSWTSITTSWTDVTIDVPLGDVRILVNSQIYNYSGANYVYLKEYSDPNTPSWFLRTITTYSRNISGGMMIFVNSSKVIRIACYTSSTQGPVGTFLMFLPPGMSGII